MKVLRWVSIGLLFYTSASGLIGAVPLIADPTGSPWQMPQSLLHSSPFHSYLIPGILLFSANGILPLCACVLGLRGHRSFATLTVFQGCVLMAWIVVECLMLRVVVWPHYLYGGVALALLLCGGVLRTAAKPRAALEEFVSR